MKMLTTVRSCEGELLAEASLLPAEASVGIVLREQRPARLLDYFICRRGRVVVIDGDGSPRHVRLVTTRWCPEGRLWFVDAA